MEQSQTYRLFMLITTPKVAEKTSELFLADGVPVHYHLNGMGTASSEMMDILGLGSAEKIALLTVLPTTVANRMLKKVNRELKLGMVNSGIAFTIPLTGANNFLLRALNDYANVHAQAAHGKDDHVMAEHEFSLITAMVKQGHSEDVMNVARAAGARGGTVIHSCAMSGEKAENLWGLTVQGEREIVLIVVPEAHKVAIMQAIGKECGVQSSAKGLVLSMPIDHVLGIKELEEDDE